MFVALFQIYCKALILIILRLNLSIETLARLRAHTFFILSLKLEITFVAFKPIEIVFLFDKNFFTSILIRRIPFLIKNSYESFSLNK